MNTDLDIHVVDVGGDAQFAAARAHLYGLLDALTLAEDPDQPGRAVRTATFRVDRPRDSAARKRAIAEPARLLHLMGHGAGPGMLRGRRLLMRTHTRLTGNRPITAAGVLLDTCAGHTPEWLHLLPDLVPAGQSILAIGVVDDLAWSQAARYNSVFYSALLHRPLPTGRPALVQRIIGAHHRASEAYQVVTRSASPFLIANLVGRGPRCR